MKGKIRAYSSEPIKLPMKGLDNFFGILQECPDSSWKLSYVEKKRIIQKRCIAAAITIQFYFNYFVGFLCANPFPAFPQGQTRTFMAGEVWIY